MESLNIKKLSAGSVYKLIFLGSFAAFVPIFFVLGILAYFDLATVSWNAQAFTGFKAIIMSPLMGAFMSLIFTAVFGSIVAFGLWLYAFIRPMNITYFKVKGEQNEA